MWCSALLLECSDIFTAHLRLASYTPLTFAHSSAFCAYCWYFEHMILFGHLGWGFPLFINKLQHCDNSTENSSSKLSYDKYICRMKPVHKLGIASIPLMYLIFISTSLLANLQKNIIQRLGLYWYIEEYLYSRPVSFDLRKSGKDCSLISKKKGIYSSKFL